MILTFQSDKNGTISLQFTLHLKTSPANISLMDWLEALILGIVQGITEFLPISSSAHLKLTKHLLGMPSTENQIYFDLMCHLGTLIALMGYLKSEIMDLLLRERHKLKPFFLALLPLIPCYFLLKPLREACSPLYFLGATLTATSLFLFLAQKMRLPTHSPARKAIIVGAAQSLALIPGISRSASTIAAGQVMGWTPREAVRFSFLLAIPTVMGGNLLELLKLNLSHVPPPSFSSCLIGFLSSWGVGTLTVRLALPYLERGRLRPFAWYCLLLGLLTTAYTLFYDN